MENETQAVTGDPLADGMVHQRKQVADAPREVPFTTALLILFGGLTNRIGWPIFGLGMIFFWVFSLRSELVEIPRFSGKRAQAKGRVTKVWETETVVNGKSVERYAYAFWTPKGLFKGTSYSHQSRYKVGGLIEVEYMESSPQINRIQGHRVAEYSLATGLFPLVVPLLGAGMIFLGLNGGRKTLYLLRKGMVAYGQLKHKKATLREVNEQVVYMMFFEFQAIDGQVYSTVTFTNETHLLEDEEDELLLYDPQNPLNAAMFDSMPGEPELDSNGQIKPLRMSTTIGVIAVPLLAIIGNLIYALYLFLT